MSKRHWSVWAIVISVAISAGARTAEAQAPITADELKTLLADAEQTAHALRRLDTLFADMQGRAKALIAEFAKHNAEPCEYPQGQPELCANYAEEGKQLGFRSTDLQKEMAPVDSRRRGDRVHFAELMTRLRTAAFPASLASQKNRLIACSNLNGVAESEACLVTAQRRKPS